MPVYEYRCRECDDRFELRRPMSQANADAVCPEGHADTVRLLSMFASHTGASLASTPSAPPMPAGGGCCGGGCGCAH